jgi:hypothetical protein
MKDHVTDEDDRQSRTVTDNNGGRGGGGCEDGGRKQYRVKSGVVRGARVGNPDGGRSRRELR